MKTTYPGAPVPCKITLYSGGQAVREFQTTHPLSFYSSVENFNQPGSNELTWISGTYVMESVESLSLNPAPAKYRITLWDSGKVVRNFEATDFSHRKNGQICITEPGRSCRTVVSGTFILEPISQP